MWGHILPIALSRSELPTRLGSFHQDLDVRPFILPQGWPKLPKQGLSLVLLSTSCSLGCFSTP